jgi:hypothetical protein
LATGFDMVYNWDDKEAECYRLYVEEKKSLDEVIAHWESKGFTPRYVSARWSGRVAVYFYACFGSWSCDLVHCSMVWNMMLTMLTMLL